MAEARAEEAEHAADEQVANRMILEEIQVLRAELAELRMERLQAEAGSPAPAQ
jgi:voltage-gated sodium channel